RACPRQQCHQIELSVQPEPEQMHQHFDYFGNPVTVFTIQVPHHELSITAESWVEVTAPDPVDVDLTTPWEQVRDGVRVDRSPAGLDACQFAFESRYVPISDELAAYAHLSFPAHRPLAQAVADL